MTVVVGTAGHIDHGKTTLLRALTGIDADRLPEERRRGMTIDVGYAHAALDDGTVIDFVDVPGHDRLVGNMLVGAGEIDAAMLVVAADDGPRAQTLEHLALLDALGVTPGIAVVTKADAVGPERVAEVRAAVAGLLDRTIFAGAPVLSASGVTGEGIDAVREALAAMTASIVLLERSPTLAVDRVFTVKGRGTVVTGTLRGGPLSTGDRLRVVPGAGEARVREIQVHGETVERVEAGGRTALNLAGVSPDGLHRGVVLTADPAVIATDRVLAAFRAPIPDRVRARVHVGTGVAEVTVGRAGRDALTLVGGAVAGVLRLAAPVAMRAGDRLVLRRGATAPPVGAVVLDPEPARGASRRRQTNERVGALADAIAADDESVTAAARLDLHGALVSGATVALAPDVLAAAVRVVSESVGDGIGVAPLRAHLARALRRTVTLRQDEASKAATHVVDELVATGTLARDGDVIRPTGVASHGPDPELAAAMDRLEAALRVTAPPALSEAARAVGCPPEGIRLLERSARIVVLEPDLAYAMSTYRDLAARALAMAARAPLTPAAYRDATGTSRKYVVAILEDLDRKALLRRTPDGHVPGPKAPAGVRAASSAR